MTKMVRKQVYIQPRQEALLKRLSRETGTTEAELIRQAIDRGIVYSTSSRLNLRAWEEEREFILRLMENGPIPGERTWEREELHER